MRKRWTLLLVALLFAGGGFGAAAQESRVQLPTPTVADCPVGLICTEWQGAVFALDPDDGPVITLITRHTTTTVESADGLSTTYEIQAVTFTRAADTYLVASVYAGPAAGVFAEARYGDVYGLARLDGADE